MWWTWAGALQPTLFKHKLQHRSTWFVDGLKYSDGRAVRNMIDFIAVKTGGLTSVTNARSYGGFRTRLDHHPDQINKPGTFTKGRRCSNHWAMVKTSSNCTNRNNYEFINAVKCFTSDTFLIVCKNKAVWSMLIYMQLTWRMASLFR